MNIEKLAEVRGLIKHYKNGEFEHIFDANYLLVRGTADIAKDHDKEASELLLNFVGKHTVDSLFKFYYAFGLERKDNFVRGIDIIEE